jgi:hypothetical protein
VRGCCLGLIERVQESGTVFHTSGGVVEAREAEEGGAATLDSSFLIRAEPND